MLCYPLSPFENFFFKEVSIYLNTAEVMIVVSKGFSAGVLILIIWPVEQCNSFL